MTAPDFAAANQAYLLAALGLVREALARHALSDDATEPPPAGAAEAMAEAAARMPASSTVEMLCALFALSPFERDLVILCAGIELDARVPFECGAAQGNLARAFPTFSLALAALPGAHWSALAPSGPLRHYRLIELAGGDGLVQAPLRIDERLRWLVEEVHPEAGELPPSLLQGAARMAARWSRTPAEEGGMPAIQLSGDDPAGRRAAAALGCARLGLRLFSLRACDLPANAADREALCRLWERESMLSQSALLVEVDDGDGSESQRAAAAFVERLRVLTAISSREPIQLRRRVSTRIDVRRPNPAEQAVLWRSSLAPIAGRLDGAVEQAVSQFNLSALGVRAASAEVMNGLDGSDGSDGDGVGTLLWDACRVQARPRLDGLAQRIDGGATWEDLVLPAAQKKVLEEIAANVRQRARVYERWGFAKQGSRGLGISALFAGVSGTGKTMAAEVLAGALRLDLYRIDLSQVVSKYIGETEKNLRRIFDAAEEGGAILLFDEADALFGKRSEVKDSHDRYANIEISYLLQRMEAYRGLAILTSNMRSALDTAFLRRIRFVVEFPFPDAAQRAEIWRRVFPSATPTERLDVTRLSRLHLPGGNIRNIALHAAFLAADAGEPVQMGHLARAARSEYAKLEKPLSDAEVGGWA